MARGRDADQPTEISGKGWLDISLRVKDAVARNRIGLIAAGIAFYGLLALFPAISALVAITALFADPQNLVTQVNELAGMVPEAVTEIVAGQVTEVTGSREGGLGFAALLGLGIALYSASKGTGSLMQGLNASYDEDEKRGTIRLYAMRLGLTLFLIVGIAIGLALAVAVPTAASVFDGTPLVEALVSATLYLVGMALAMLGLAMIYRHGPSRENARFSWVSPGAAIATLLWIVASAGFAFYVGNFANYNETFGTLAGVVILLTWFWLSAYIVLLGAEINAETEAQTAKDSTIGPREPKGERGAVKADNLGEAQAASS